MKLTPIAAASLIPATIAGIAFSVMPFVNGSTTVALTTRPAAHVAHTASHVRPSAHRSAQHATATAAAKPAATASTAAPASNQPASSQPASSQPAAGTATATSSQPLTAGMSSFEQCVAWRESGDNPTASSAGLFGILPSVWAQLGYSGTAGQASVAQQKVAFDQLYAEYGAQPWAPSDGC
jgi:hypothetical protein